MSAWGEPGCRDYCCESARSSLVYVSGFALRSACRDSLQVEVEGAQTHFKIKDPVFGGTLSCMVVFDLGCRYRGAVACRFFFFISVRPRRKKLGLCPFIDLLHQTLQTGPNRDNIVNLGWWWWWWVHNVKPFHDLYTKDPISDFFLICNLPIINWEVNQKNATLHICNQLHRSTFCVFIYDATTSSYVTWVNKYECMLRCCCDPSPTLKSVPFSPLWSLCFQSL